MTRSPSIEISVSLNDMDMRGGIPAAIATRLRDAIISGELPAGSLLRQEKISQLFQAGRPPVREALTLLEAEGLVVSRPRRGFAVAPLDPNDVDEIFDIRMLLEERAAYFAAQRRSLQDVFEMERLIIAMEGTKISNSQDAAAFSLVNRDFHQLIHRASGRPQTASLLLALRNKLERYIRLGGLISGDPEQVNRDHRMIFEAFRDGEADRMAVLCREHIRSAGKRLVAVIKSKHDEAAAVPSIEVVASEKTLVPTED